MAQKSRKTCSRHYQPRLSGTGSEGHGKKTLQDIPRQGQDTRQFTGSPHYVRSANVTASHFAGIRSFHPGQQYPHRNRPHEVGEDDIEVGDHEVRILESLGLVNLTAAKCIDFLRLN